VKPLILLTPITLLILLLAAPAHAWTRPGHMVTAAIVYEELKAQDPGIVREILRIMSHHPERGAFEVAVKRYEGEARNKSIFVEIARWPDDIRGGEHDHPTWHYFLRPVADDKAPPADTSVMKPIGAALQAFALNLDVAGDTAASDSNRAVALCWLFHIVGDIHQPLHNAQRYGADWPKGDHGGGRVFVRDPITKKPIALHWLWDDAINRSPDMEVAFEVGRRLMRDYPRSMFAKQLLDRDVEAIAQWSDESYRLAASLVYRQDAPRATTALNARPPAKSYWQAAQPIAEQRATLSAYRLSDLLRQILPPRGGHENSKAQN